MGFHGISQQVLDIAREGTRRGLPHICRYFRIGPNGGSAFDEWLAMGAPKELTAEELRYLKSKSIPTRQIVKHNELDDITVLVQPLEVVQLIISACDE